MTMRIAISGAGIAGPTLAHWLLRHGHAPTLIERAPAFRTGGYVIDFWGAGYEVARRMGLEAAILEAGYQVHTLRAVDDDGHVLANMRTEFANAKPRKAQSASQVGPRTANTHMSA